MVQKENSNALKNLIFQTGEEQKYFQNWDLPGVVADTA